MIQSKKIIAIIPARGGSKELPGKNTKRLAGLPLLAWTIAAARKSRYIDTLAVSTDSAAIAHVADTYGAKVPFIRPSHLATDHAKMMDVILHCIKFFEKNNDPYEIVLLLQPTSPLRESIDIDRAIEFLLQKKARAVVGVAECEHSPLWTGTLPRNLSMKNFAPHAARGKTRQQLDTYYRINGALYIAYATFLQRHKNWFSSRTYAYVMDRGRSIDIDSQEDFIMAEVFLRKRLHKSNSNARTKRV